MKPEMLVSSDPSAHDDTFLGERYNLGEPVAVYKIAYTDEDTRRIFNQLML